MLNRDPHAQAEKFIETVIAPLRKAEAATARDIKGRAKLAGEERDLVLRALSGSVATEKLDALAKSRSDHRKKLAAGERRRADDLAADFADRIRDMGPLFPLDPADTVIDEVTFIRSFAGQGSVIESNIAPGDNWARYDMKSTSDLWDGTGRLSFFTLWQNPLDANAQVAPLVSLAVNAHISCDADWSGVASWFGLDSEASATMHVRTTIWGMDVSIRSVVDDRDLGDVSVSGGFFGDDASTNITFNEPVQCSSVVVPPRTYVLFEVEILTDWKANTDASVHVDAQSNARKVTLSQILLRGVPPQQPPAQFTLSGTVTPQSGGIGTIALTWTGATGARVDVYQDNIRVADTENDGSFTLVASSGTHQYRVCQSNSATCSNSVSLVVP